MSTTCIHENRVNTKYAQIFCALCIKTLKNQGFLRVDSQWNIKKTKKLKIPCQKFQGKYQYYDVI